MGAATEGAGIVDQAIAGLRIEQGTCARRICRQRFAACRAQRPCSEKSFPFRQVRCAASQLEMAALFYAHAAAVNRPRREIGVNLANFLESCVHASD